MSKELQRLDKVLSNSGVGSRKDVKLFIKKGLVSVDGEVVKDSAYQLSPEVSEVFVNGNQINYRKYIYIMMNKPAGVISATTDKRNKTAIDLLPEEFSSFEVFPAGRLDIDTEGLLLLTNDGPLAHEILSPKKHVPKTYFAKIEGKVVDEDIARFKERIVLDDGYKCLPADLKVLKQEEISEIELTIHEGKFHQVKRMFESVEKKVIYLKRIAMGNMKLDETLALGSCREITQEELEKLQEQIDNDKS